MRILIIDDNAHHAELAARRLMKEGWEVFVTDTPDVTSKFKDYDFILLDYSMPLKSGLDVLQQIKEAEIYTPVILVTGHGNETIASEAIKRGAYDYVVKDTQLLYLDRLPSVLREAKSKHELIETNRFLIQELKRANERLQRLTFTDEMTGIFNYRFMKKQLETEIQRSTRYAKPLSACLIDVDHFKTINDRYGHQAGDSVLKDLAKLINEATRSVDFVGRYAGDEFMIIFPDTVVNDAVRLCERIRKRVADHSFIAHDQQIRVSISVGVADFDLKRRKAVDTLVEASDKCLYKAKELGRNRVVSTVRGLEKKSEASVSVSP